MVTTDNEVQNTPPKPTAGSRSGDVTSDDVKAMKADYNKGENISTIASAYGYTEAEVQAAVVKEAKD